MLKNIYVLKIELELLSGLYIGGNDVGFDIGGADSNVIKNPLTHEPYIPGSSFKGKLKSLLRYRYGKIENNKMVFTDDAYTRIFEPLENNEGDNINISRAIFRDLFLTIDSKKELTNNLGEGCFTEIKAENKIDPIKGKAETPRFIERVPAGAVFQGEIILNVFDGDDEEKMKNGIYKALNLLKSNYLGGNGSRGYGRVDIKYSKFEEEKL